MNGSEYLDRLLREALVLATEWKHAEARPAHIAAALVNDYTSHSPRNELAEVLIHVGLSMEHLREQLDLLPTLPRITGKEPFTVRPSYSTERVRNRAEGSALSRGQLAGPNDVWLALMAEHDDGTLTRVHNVEQLLLGVASAGLLQMVRHLREKHRSHARPHKVMESDAGTVLSFIRQNAELGQWALRIKNDQVSLHTDQEVTG